MSTLLKQLEANESLLMYLADELPANDRAEVEQRLANDPALREALDDLRSAQALVHERLRADDAAMPLPVSSTVAVRHVSRAIRQWQVDRLTAPVIEVETLKGLRYPLWVYPTSAAAALFLAFLVWWGNWGHDRLMPEQITVRMQAEAVDPDLEERAEQVTAWIASGDEHVSELNSIDAAADELMLISQDTGELDSMFESLSEEGT